MMIIQAMMMIISRRMVMMMIMMIMIMMIIMIIDVDDYDDWLQQAMVDATGVTSSMQRPQPPHSQRFCQPVREYWNAGRKQGNKINTRSIYIWGSHCKAGVGGSFPPTGSIFDHHMQNIHEELGHKTHSIFAVFSFFILMSTPCSLSGWKAWATKVQK